MFLVVGFCAIVGPDQTSSEKIGWIYFQAAIHLGQNEHHLNPTNFNHLAALKLMGLSTTQRLVVDPDAVAPIDNNSPFLRLGIKVYLGVESGNHLAGSEVDVNPTRFSIWQGASVYAWRGAVLRLWVQALRRPSNIIPQLLHIKGPALTGQLCICLDSFLAMLLVQGVGMVFAGLDEVFRQGQVWNKRSDQLVISHLNTRSVLW
jgi:hypothetical protein